jgi:homoserine O-acetyltransferase
MFERPLDTLEWMDKLTADNRASGFDATDWMYQSWAYQTHDVGTTPGVEGGTAAALASIECPSLILAPPLDLFNPPAAAMEAADAIPNATLLEVPSVQGHQSAGTASPDDVAFLNEEIGAFLRSVPLGDSPPDA